MHTAFRYLLIVAAVVLAWETVKVPVLVRAAARAPIFMTANSPEALGLIAEKHFVAERYESAGIVAEEAVSRAPFNARALRVLGLVRAEDASRLSEADQIVTLAGNWSLRDDPAHAWLIERRLQQGSFSSAFAHADTLARRREDLHPAVFQLFTRAAAMDPRSLPHLSRLVSLMPPWRWEYMAWLRNAPNGDAILFQLASDLAGKPGALTNAELEVLYKHWLAEGRIEAIRQIRRRTAPNAADTLVNGDFETEHADQSPPFGWQMGNAPNLSVQIVPDDLNLAQKALRVQSIGDRAMIALDQFLLLPPGEYRLMGRYRVELGELAGHAQWILRCVEAPAPREISLEQSFSNQSAWTSFSGTFRIPDRGCTGQHLQLLVQGGEFRSTLAFWVDNVRLAVEGGE